MNDPFDRWLGTNLSTDLDRAVGTPTQVSPRYRARQTSRRLRLIGLTSIPLVFSLRLATALAAAGLAAGGGTAVLIVSHTSHAPLTTSHASTVGTTNNPSGVVSLNSSLNSSSGPPASNHGAAVTSAVASCKAARPSPHASPKPSPGSRGIGDCVSIVASGGRAGGGTKGNGHSSPSHPTPKPHPTSH
jgi:hypothetical protein